MQTGNPMTLQITLNDHLVETAGKPADSKDVSCFPLFGISKKSNSLEALFQAAHSELQTISNSESIQPVINVPAELLLASSTIEIIHLPSTAVHKTSNFSSSRPILAKFGSSIESIPQPPQPKDVATLLPIAPVPAHDRMSAVVSKPKLPGKYTCSYCFRHCAKPSVLQKHLRAHTGERPYPCNKCGLNFKTKSNLYKHCKTRSHLLQVQSADDSTEQVEVDSSNVSEAVKVEASSAVVEMNRYGAAEEVVSKETEADINESCTDVAQLLIQKQQQQDQQLRQQLQNSPAAVPCHMLELPQNCTLLQLPDGVVYIMEKLENGQAILRPLHEQLAISQPPVAVNQQQMAVSQQDSVLAPQQLSFGQPQSMYGQPPSPVRQPQLAVGQSQQAVGQSQHAVNQSQIAVGQSQLAVGQSQLAVCQSQHAVVQSQIAVGQSHQTAGQSQLAVGQSQLPVGQSQLTSSQHELALNEKQLMLNYTDAISSTSTVASKLIPRTAFMSKGLTVPNSEFHSTGTEFGPHTKVLTKSLSANSANACYSLGPAIFPMTRSPSLTNCQGITPKLAPIDPKTMTSKAVQDRIAMLISQNASIIDTPMADAPRPKRIVRQSSEVNVGNSIDGANVPSSKTMVRAKSLTPAEAASLDSTVSHARSDGMRKAASVNFEMQPNDGASRACTNFLSVPPDPNLFGKLPEKRLEPVEPAPRLLRLGLPSQSLSGGGDISTSAPSQQIIQFSSPTNTTTRSQSVGDCFHFQLSSSSPHSMNLISSSRHMSADGFKIGTREPLAKDASNKRRDFAKPRSSNSSNVTIDSDDLEIASDVLSNHNYPSVTVDKEISKEIVPSNSPEHIILPSNSLMPVRIEIVDPLVAPRRGRPKGSKNRSKLSSATSSTTDFDNSPKITSPSTIPQICVTPAESDVPTPTTESLWKRKLIGRIMSKRSLSMERSASEEISDPLSTPSIISASNSLLQTLMSSKVANSCSETLLQRSQSYDAAMPLKKRRKTLTELGRGTAFGTRIEEAGGASSPQRDSSGSRSEKLKSPSDLRSRSPESDVENLARMREDQMDVRKSESCRSPELTCLVNARGTFPIALKLKSGSMSQGPGKYLSTSVSQEDRFAEADVPPILDISCETINNIPAGNNSVDSRTRKLRYYEVSKQGMVRAISELTLFDKDDSPEKPRNFLRSNSDSKNDVFEEEVVASIGIENSALSASLVMSLPTGRSTDVAITQRPVIIMQGDDKMPSIIQDHETTSSSDKKEVQTDLNLDRPSRSKSDLLFTAACVSEPKTGVLTHSSYWNYKIGRDREHKTVLDTSDAVEHVSKSDPVERKKMITEQHKYVGTFDALKEKLSLHEKNVIRRENRIQIFPGGYKSTEEYVYIRGRGKGRYVCGKCGIRCKKPSMLRKHLRTHTDSRPHRCEVCDFGFKTKGNLSKHVKSKSHHARSSSLGSIPGSHRAPMLHKDDRLCVSEQTLGVPDMEMSDCDNADLNSEKDDEEEEEDDDVSLELKIEKEEIEDSTSLIIGEIVPVALHRTELSTVQDKFRRAKSDSEAAASLLDLSKGDTDVLTEDGASIHKTTVAASSAFSSNIGVVETKRISDVLEARTLSSKRSLSASNIRSLESTVGDPVTKSGICSEQPLVSGVTTHCKLPISNNNEVKNPCFVKSDVPSSMFNLSPSTLLPQNSEARSSRLLSVYMLNRPLNKPDMIKTGSTENSSPRPFSEFQPQPSSGFQPLSSSGFQPLSSSGFQPLSSSGFQPQSFSGFQPQSSSGFQPLSSSGFQPQSSSGFQPLSSSGFQPQSFSGFQPLSSSGFQPQSSSGFQPLSSSGFQPQSSNGFQPQSSSGFQPQSSSGFQPQSSSGFQPQSSSEFQPQSSSGFQPQSTSGSQSSSGSQKSQSSKLIRIPCEIIPVPGRVVESEEGCVNGKYICPVCQKSFGHQHQLTLHRNIHYLERPHKCQDCDMSFQNRTLLDRHERSVRHQSKSDDPRPYKCDDCSVAFRIHGHLAKHMRSKAHVSKLENVGKMTTDVSTDSNEIDENETSLDGGIEDQNNLKSPETIPRIHCPSPVESSPSDRRLRIDLSPVCHKFAEDAEIKRSNKNIPGQEKITSSGSDDAPQQDVFHHKCNICEKTFADIQLFQRHVNSHAELRPFICEQCDAGFTSSHMLTRHLETHKQVRDCCHDTCDHCGFTLKENQLDKNAATQLGSGSADLNPSSEDINSVTVLTSPVNRCDCKRTCDKDVSLDTSRLPAFIQSSMFANSGSLLPMRNANIILSCSAIPLSLAGSTGLALLLPNPSNSFSNDSAALLTTESGTSVLLPTSSLSLPLSLSSALHSVLVSSAGLISRQSSVSPGVVNEDHVVTISDIENRSTSSKQ